MPPVQTITSVQNERVKRWATLRDAKHRQKERLFVLEGLRLVEEGLKSSLRIVAVCSSDAAWLNDLQAAETCERFVVTREIVAKCCSTESPQPTFAIAEIPDDEPNFDWQKAGFVLALDAIQDPGNMGAILRTAAAAGVDVVAIGEGCVDLYSPKVLRAAMGATFRVPLVHRDLSAVLPKLREAGCQILASVSRDGAENCFRMKLHARKIAWIVGNEGGGISEAVLSHADTLVTIPMSRQTESLNVAQATAILLYETVRQKKYRS